LAALADQNDAEFFGCLTGAEREWLERLLKRLVKHGPIKLTQMRVHIDDHKTAAAKAFLDGAEDNRRPCHKSSER
jgi:hypothetical protein